VIILTYFTLFFLLKPEKLESYKEKAEIELTQDSDNNNL